MTGRMANMSESLKNEYRTMEKSSEDNSLWSIMWHEDENCASRLLEAELRLSGTARYTHQQRRCPHSNYLKRE